MIIDTLKNCEIYYGVHPRFEKAFDFIKKACAEKLPVGKYEIDGKNLYAMVQEYDSNSPENTKFEAHRNYIDIQYIISGTENMQAFDISDATLNTEYNSENDVIFFENTDQVTTGFLKKRTLQFSLLTMFTDLEWLPKREVSLSEKLLLK